MITFEFDEYYKKKYKSFCGCDEVGRGPIAGPVVACSVIVNDEFISGVNDSKKISLKKREILSELITSKYTYALGEASVKEIEEINILNATILAIKRAIASLPKTPEVMLIDGNMKFLNPRYINIIKGDQKSYSIACASIVAKVYRDNLMKKLSVEYPEYGWDHNAGYGTKKHIDAINKFGITKHHRKNFIHI